MFLHDRNFEFSNRIRKIHIFLNFTKKCVNSHIPSHFYDFLIEKHEQSLEKNMF